MKIKLHQIAEPQPDDVIVGIDLGTTNSLIGYFDGTSVKIVPDRYSENGIIPSIVVYIDNKIKVGHEALLYSKYIRSAKRLIGKGVSDDICKSYDNIDYDSSSQSMIRLKIDDITTSPIEVSSEILKYLKNNAENFIGKPVNRAVITVPAHFDDAARKATKDAATLAGIEVLRIINEPTAAAIAYGLKINDSDITLVYDLGGGTFDVSLLRRNHGITVVIGTGGDNQLGGDDFDIEIVKLMCKKTKIDFDTIQLSQEILQLATTCKKCLSTHNEWSGVFLSDIITVRVEEMIAVCQTLINRTIQITLDVLHQADIQPQDVKNIILAGGATHIPTIQRSLKNLFNKTPLNNINPEQVVVIGATLQAKYMTTGGDILVDVVPLSLGIELLGGIVEVIIPKNTAIPTVVRKIYTTYKDHQNAFKIHVVQGEGSTVKECRSLGKFELSGITQKLAGEVQLEIVFRVDSNGILVVTATELESGKSCEIEVKPTYGLSENEVLTLLGNT